MGIVECVRKGFQVAAKSRDLVLVMFAFAFIWNLVNLPFNAQLQEPTANVSLAVMPLSIVFIAASIFMQSGSLGYVHEVLKSGQSSLTQFKAAGQKYYLRILGVSVIVGLFIVILSVLAALAVLVGGENPNAISIVLALIIGLFGAYGVLLVFLAPYIVVDEDAKVMDSIKASIAVVKANFLKVLGIGVLLLLVGFGMGILLGAVVTLLGNLFQGFVGQIISGFFASAVNAFLGVVVTAAFMAYYLSVKGSGSSST
jgi:hypothetical protein